MPADTDTLIQSLQDPRVYDHDTRALRLVETHISWVVLTGPYAYKIKKPVNLGFLDFSTLEKRRFYCQEELRLNRRLAPSLYIDVVDITGTPTKPVLNGSGRALEYAVKMVQFPQEAQLDRVLARGELKKDHIDELAHIVAAFHHRAPVADPQSSFGRPEQIHALVLTNFNRLLSSVPTTTDSDCLQALKSWSQKEYERIRTTLSKRKEKGFIRECHGDMHLRNMALLHGGLLIFDGIEFNEEIRWIDVLSEAAFVIMDLDDRAHPALARRFLNAYLELTGDYEGLQVLRYYLTYRAMVRAMVDSIRATQASIDVGEKRKMFTEYGGYVALAQRYTHLERPALITTRGFSGSGKTTVAQAVLEQQSAIRIRSDVERKRLHGLAAAARTRSDLDQKLYTAEATARTYARLAELANALLHCGYTVIVDAALLKRAQRDLFRSLAEVLRVPFLILDCQAPMECLRARVLARECAGGDASEANLAVLERQLATHEPLTECESAHALVVDTTQPPDPTRIDDALRQRLASGNAAEPSSRNSRPAG